MEWFNFISQFVYYIVPGIFGVYIFNYAMEKKNQSTNFILINSFILSTVSFIIGNIFLKLLNYLEFVSFQITEVVDILSGLEQSISLYSFVTAIIISVFIAILLIRLLSYDKIFELLNKFGITKNKHHDNICKAFIIENSWVVFRDFEKKLYYYGQVDTISNDNDNLLRNEFVLANVTVYNEDGVELSRLGKLYISRNHNEFSIETFNFNESSGENEE